MIAGWRFRAGMQTSHINTQTLTYILNSCVLRYEDRYSAIEFALGNDVK